ncbi:hypothetical protein [Streptomyces sp. NPDC014894]|uniref:hypothetical protein n=1 Tax=Streptomyces sp. NPDC014894 TaxID=3364931 RepID=UPI0037027AD4
MTAVLYAVFVGGWFLGQPLHQVGCEPSGPPTAAARPVTIAEPGDVTDDFSRMAVQVTTIADYEIIPADAVVACDLWTPRPRLVAWVIGDWR